MSQSQIKVFNLYGKINYLTIFVFTNRALKPTIMAEITENKEVFTIEQIEEPKDIHEIV